ncbi:MAG TPA: type II toxin-antitoxin system RelE/ParE family toxin [Acidobacteriota bacterium]
MYQIRVARDVEKDLKKLKARDRKLVVDAIQTNLSYQPTIATRNRKILASLIPPWNAEPPIWELRVGDYRVFYDVSEAEETVFVRAIRRKPGGQTTEEIL